VPGALGFVPHDELERLYRRAAVVACPSRREGFGVVCAEAMAHRRTVVASAVGGLLDLVVDGESGLLVPVGDPGALAGAILRLLQEPELAARLAAEARRRVRDRYSEARMVELTLGLYARS
jgi:glycosyltransferase involved in cell wall biosynthesis